MMEFQRSDCCERAARLLQDEKFESLARSNVVFQSSSTAEAGYVERERERGTASVFTLMPERPDVLRGVWQPPKRSGVPGLEA